MRSSGSTHISRRHLLVLLGLALLIGQSQPRTASKNCSDRHFKKCSGNSTFIIHLAGRSVKSLLGIQKLHNALQKFSVSCSSPALSSAEFPRKELEFERSTDIFRYVVLEQMRRCSTLRIDIVQFKRDSFGSKLPDEKCIQLKIFVCNRTPPPTPKHTSLTPASSSSSSSKSGRDSKTAEQLDATQQNRDQHEEMDSRPPLTRPSSSPGSSNMNGGGGGDDATTANWLALLIGSLVSLVVMCAIAGLLCRSYKQRRASQKKAKISQLHLNFHDYRHFHEQQQQLQQSEEEKERHLPTSTHAYKSCSNHVLPHTTIFPFAGGVANSNNWWRGTSSLCEPYQQTYHCYSTINSGHSKCSTDLIARQFQTGYSTNNSSSHLPHPVEQLTPQTLTSTLMSKMHVADAAAVSSGPHTDNPPQTWNTQPQNTHQNDHLEFTTITANCKSRFVNDHGRPSSQSRPPPASNSSHLQPANNAALQFPRNPICIRNDRHRNSHSHSDWPVSNADPTHILADTQSSSVYTSVGGSDSESQSSTILVVGGAGNNIARKYKHNESTRITQYNRSTETTGFAAPTLNSFSFVQP